MDEMINQIICGDCLQVMKKIPSNSIDLILTDPPYGINFCSHRTNRNEYIINDKYEDCLHLLPKMLKEFKRILTNTGCCCCCCGGGGGGKTPVTAIFTMEVVKYFNLIQTLVWEKFIGLGWRYRPAYENILILSKSKNKYNFYDTTNNCANVIKGINQDIPQEGEHPTQKPIALMQKLIEIHSLPNMLIFDPFCGSGTTCVAAKELGRRFIGIEIKPEYVEMARKRLQQEYFNFAT